MIGEFSLLRDKTSTGDLGYKMPGKRDKRKLNGLKGLAEERLWRVGVR
jgi:hypothetical protein